uniref:cytochrome c oxidase assembly protein COX16 homolog, mitochondrial isoform X1 n=1 Tax=Myxine glutinosa TaxID=7769 RepID=UPI00358F1AAB
MNFKAFFRGKTFRYGVPMLVLIIGGSVGLKEFTTIRYEAMARRTKIDPALDALFDKAKRKTTLEDHYEKLNQVDLNSWVNIRGPREGDDSRAIQEEQRKQLKSSH